MKRIVSFVVLVGVATLAFAGGASHPGRSIFVRRVHAQEGCSVATLNGAYGFYRTGTTPGGPLVAVGIATFDGTGAVATARQTIRKNGITTQDLFTGPTISTPYEVDPDCTGRFVQPDGSVYAHVVVVNHGKEIFGLSLSTGNSVYGVWKKIDQEE
jgi:hypothetical protein